MLELIGASAVHPYGARPFGAVDMTLPSGSVLAVTGPEASGKTTFLKMIAGAVEFEGKVLLGGTPVRGRRDGVIMVFDDGAVFPLRSALYNISYPLLIRGADKTEAREAAERAAEIMDITACLPFRAGALSPEERRRMSLARLFVRDAELLLADEPCRGLSRESAERVWAHLAPLLAAKAKEGKTVIYSTSDRREALSIADRVVVLGAGRVTGEGTPEELLSSPRDIRAAEWLAPHYNRAKCTLSDENGVLKLYFVDGLVLDISSLRDRIAEGAPREVYAGWYPDGGGEKLPALSGEESYIRPVVFAERTDAGAILTLEGGFRAAQSREAKTADMRPTGEGLTLFSTASGRSVMKEKA